MKLDDIASPKDIRGLSEKELKTLAVEIREFLIKSISVTGGHLSSNLGVVELTLALHRIFDTPQDQILWDVGHQSYVHKILTGRKKDFSTLRQKSGLSGYPNPQESPYDVIHSGHSSTSISIAAGLARAKRLVGDNSATVAVIGDGSFTAGVVYEALNTISQEKLPVIIILNDNGMSISKNVGGISNYLKKIRTSPSYIHMKKETGTLIGKIPLVGHFLRNMLYGTKEKIKEVLVPGKLFQDIGIEYLGPVDGHNIPKLETLFSDIKKTSGPVMIHVITQKGKGHKPSEEDPSSFHGVSCVKIEKKDEILPARKGKSFSNVLGETLCELAEHDAKIFAITAAMTDGTGLANFAKQFPDRFSDVGIAEQHAVTYALGLALEGLKPVVCIYSTFLQRAYDQLVHDIGISKKGVLFCLDRAGLVPADGETHQGIFDIAYLRTIPNFQILLPSGETEMKMMLHYALENLDGPIAIRYPKDIAENHPDYDAFCYPIVKGEAIEVCDGTDILIITCGTLLNTALEARKHLQKQEISLKILNLRFAKPINKSVIDKIAKTNIPVLILEEGIENGGIGQAIRAELSKRFFTPEITTLNIPDVYPQTDTRKGLLKNYGLTLLKILDTILNVLKRVES